MFSRNNNIARVSFRLIVVLLCGASLSAYAALCQSAFTLDGKPLDPFRAGSGKPVVLIFVRTDCPISNRYAPVIRGLYDSQYHLLASFWLVYPDKKTTAKEIRGHLSNFDFGISALRDPDHVLVKQASATITPEAAVFDAHGALLYHGRIDNLYFDAGRTRPAATTHELQDAIESALLKKNSMPASAPAVGCYISDLK